jgi:MarR family transcriptional regulator, 2-MHQ and catechol-resistance regulon repressor
MKRKCTNHPFLLLMQTAREFQEQIRDDMAQNNLSITEFSVLEVLFHKGKQTIQQIAKSILIASSSMTYVIDKLEQKGLIKRNACPDDRRVVHVILTEDGLKLMTILMPEHEELVDNAFNSLHPNEIENLVFLLKKVKVRLGK